MGSLLCNIFHVVWNAFTCWEICHNFYIWSIFPNTKFLISRQVLLLLEPLHQPSNFWYLIRSRCFQYEHSDVQWESMIAEVFPTIKFVPSFTHFTRFSDGYLVLGYVKSSRLSVTPCPIFCEGNLFWLMFNCNLNPCSYLLLLWIFSWLRGFFFPLGKELSFLHGSLNGQHFWKVSCEVTDFNLFLCWLSFLEHILHKLLPQIWIFSSRSVLFIWKKLKMEDVWSGRD
jgi:hypothetical protein